MVFIDFRRTSLPRSRGLQHHGLGVMRLGSRLGLGLNGLVRITLLKTVYTGIGARSVCLYVCLLRLILIKTVLID